MDAIGERLRHERERLGMTQEAFAKEAGVTKRTQINYESGARTPDMKYIGKIGNIGADMYYVATGEHAVNLRSPSESAAKAEQAGTVYKLPEAQSGLLTEKEVCSIVLDALYTARRLLPAAKIWAIVDAAMALQRGGITVDKSTLHEQLRLVK